MRNQLRILFFISALFCGVCGAIGQCTPDSVLYSYTGGTQTFTVPGCVTTITVKAWGAAGAGGGTDCDGGGSGGGGAYSSGVITVVPSTILTVIIGGGGKPGANNKAGVGAGAGGYGYGDGGEGGEPGHENPGGVSGAGAGGGGGTAVVSGVTPLLVAGGGGGGAGGGCSSAGGGGGGGGQNGFSGTGPGGAAGGSGNDNGVIGSSGTFDCGGAGGGGGGLNGGDSGHVTECDCGGGGGGGGNCLGTIIVNGNGATPGYKTYPGLPVGYALGGAPNVGAAGLGGGNGYLIIEYCVASGITASTSYTSPTCFGSNNGTATANPSGGILPYTYLWTPTAQTNQTATGLSAGTYTVTVNDAAGCTVSASVTLTQPAAINTIATSVPADSACAGQSVTLNASGATTYLWSTGGTSSSITVIIPAGDTAYYGVKGMNGPCSDSTALKIKIIPLITATIAKSVDSICQGQISTLTVTASGGQATYSWSPGGATSSSIPVSPTATTTYTTTITGLCNTFTKTITVTYVPLPIPVISGTSWKCHGVKDTLTVSSSNGASRYVWSNGSTKTSITTGSIDADSTITVTAYNALGCSKDTTFKITLRAPPAVTIPLPAPACGGSPVMLTANATGTGPFSYIWSPPGTGNTSSVTVSPDSATTYTVTVSNGCITTKTATVLTGNPLIGACCSTAILKGNDITMVATGDTSIKSYMWAPSVNCLDPPLCDSVKATPTVTTTYTVIGTDRAGCQSERIVTITVETPCFNFIVPNVFTPNNAGTLGLDKVFYINTANTNITAWSILIVDRWGKEVYNSTNPTQYWDGNTQGGGQAPSGVYYYIINATCAGSTSKKDGFVQVIR